MHDCHETDVHQEPAAAERSDVFSVIDKDDEVLKESLCTVEHFLEHHYEEAHHQNKQAECVNDLSIADEVENEI